MTTDQMPEKYQIGGIPATMTNDEYPGLPAWWTSVRHNGGEDQFARVYGDTPQEANARARLVADALNTRATPPKSQGVEYEWRLADEAEKKRDLK